MEVETLTSEQLTANLEKFIETYKPLQKGNHFLKYNAPDFSELEEIYGRDDNEVNYYDNKINDHFSKFVETHRDLIEHTKYVLVCPSETKIYLSGKTGFNWTENKEIIGIESDNEELYKNYYGNDIAEEIIDTIPTSGSILFENKKSFKNILEHVRTVDLLEKDCNDRGYYWIDFVKWFKLENGTVVAMINTMY